MTIEEDGMDSLFEGMELFTPSQLVHEKEERDCALPHSASPSTVDDACIATDASTADHHQQLSVGVGVPEPLDENLFSDLTIIAPLQAQTQTLTSKSHPIPTPSISNLTTGSDTISRQSSRKKKRAAGLRIGYGRDNSSFDDFDAPSQPPPSAPTPLPTPNLLTQPQPQPQSQSQSQSLLPPTAPNHHCDEYDQDHARFKYDTQFQLIKDKISDKLRAAQELVAAASTARKESIRNRRKVAQNLNLVSAKHSLLESQLEDACEAEDFEKAERISESLASAEKERQALVLAIKEAEALCLTTDSQVHNALDFLTAAEQDSAYLLSHFAKEAHTNASLVLEEAEAFSLRQTQEWFSSTEALEAMKIELDVESHLMKEVRVTLDDSIEHCIEDDNEEREILSKKKDVLTGELHKLLILVKQKEMEISKNDAKIKVVEQRITDVLAGFQEMQSNIDTKYNNLQSDLAKVHFQSEVLSTKKQEIDGFVAKEQDKGAKLRELAMISEDEAKAYQEVVEQRKNLQASILKSREDTMRLAKTQEKLTEDVQMLQKEVSSVRASQKEFSSAKSRIQQNMSSFKQRILFIDKRVPELEAEKKIAAAARNFKEAARIAAEAKSLSVERDNVHMDLEKASLELEKLEEYIKDTVRRLHDFEGLILSKEKEVAMARVQQLDLVASAATAERFAALELGDTEEANLLLDEAEGAIVESKKLQAIYNFKEEEFLNLSKHFISLELVSKLGKKQLAELSEPVDQILCQNDQILCRRGL